MDPPHFPREYPPSLLRSKGTGYGRSQHMIGKAVLGCIALTSTAAFADNRTYEIRPDAKNTAEFHAEDSYDAFDGRTHKVTGGIVADPANPSAATVEVSIDMASLDTANSLRNREMRELYLDTGKHPTANFKSVSVEAPASIAPNAPAGIKVTGDFTLHGG